MKKNKVLKPHQLQPSVKLVSQDFTSTAKLSASRAVFGQVRAINAIEYGIFVDKPYFHTVVVGSHGLGKIYIVKDIVGKYAQKQTAFDTCYIYNFKDVRRPKNLFLPVGIGQQLKQDMRQLVTAMKHALLQVQGSKLVKFAIEKTNKQFDSKLKELYQRIDSTDQVDRDVIRLEYNLSEEKRKQIKLFKMKYLTEILTFDFSACKNQYKKFPELVSYLEDVEDDFMTYFDKIDLASSEHIFNKYTVNLLSNHSKEKGAPVILVDNPSYENLFGYIETETKSGTIYSDFMSIRSGALHQANGGFLIVDAQKLLLESDAWDAVKRLLESGKIEFVDHHKAANLSPMPVPFKVKLIFITTRNIYNILCEDESRLMRFFKVIAEFDNSIKLNKSNSLKYAKWIQYIVEQEELRPLKPLAVYEVIKQSSRLLEDAEKITLKHDFLTDLLIEANYIAEKNNLNVVTAGVIKDVIVHRSTRDSKMMNQILEDIRRKYILLDTKGERVGVINGLSVVQEGECICGHPIRISAVASVGRGGDVINIEREVDLSGPIHSKGVLIITGFLKKRYIDSRPLTLSASLVFEQNYDSIDGDSASVAELCVLLTTIANIPIKQSLAITGSINQHGEIQAISSVNEKIEGFYKLCLSRKLTGEQGVLIPESNIQNLVLTDEVVEAVKSKQFSIYPVASIDDALSLLTGMPAGKLRKDGSFTPGSVNERIKQALDRLAKDS